MNISAAEIRKLVVPLLVLAALLGAGVFLVQAAGRSLTRANDRLAATQKDLDKARQRLARIAEEEREVKEKLAIYQRLRALHVIGHERRLEWADAMSRIRKSRDLLDLRYRVDPRKDLVSVPGKPGNVDFFTSTMKVDIALLDENDLFDFLSDLRDSGNAYYSVRRCAIDRVNQAPAAGAMAPRLRAECVIDLITVQDGAAK